MIARKQRPTAIGRSGHVTCYHYGRIISEAALGGISDSQPTTLLWAAGKPYEISS